MNTHPYAGRHRAAKSFLRRPAALTSGFVLPASAAVALLITATGASVAESRDAAAPVRAGAAASDVSATTAAEQLSDVTTVQQRRSAANARSAVLLARDQESARAARAAERAALAKKRSAQRWVQPIHGGTFTSGYKMRWGRMHEGDDFSTPVGTPIRSMSTGTVIYTGWYGGGGNTTKIRYWDGTVSFFEHQSRITAKVGQRVAPGQLVGYSGNTGHSTGPHLHIEIHPHGGHSIDPLPWLHKHGLFTKQG